MSFKEKLSSFLFGSRKEEAEEAPLAEQEHIPQEDQEPAADAAPKSASQLDIPMDHPLRQLYDLCRKEGASLPAPQLYMDGEGVLSQEVLEKEKNRLQSSLKSVCGTRLKAAKGRTRGKHSKKKAEEEEEEAPVLDARPWFYLSSDKLCAWMLVFPPVGEGAEVTREMIQQALEAQGICFGVNTALLDRAVRDRDRYFNLFLVARGKPAFDGRNGNIVDYFPREIQRILEADEFGQVDYTSLNLICNVKEGQEICRLIRPTEGEPGRTVLDQEVPAKAGKAVPLPKGRNTEASEDGDSLLASIPGHVEFTGHSFQVKPVLDIDGDVDFSTGNIKFVGDVNIKGDVITGFAVKAMGNVYVGGVVEAGGAVEAGGDLTVVKGILGDGSTVIQSSRCIFAKYIENATIYARENLQTDCIVNGRIYCDGEVILRSGRGNIIGGRVWAAKRVSANAIGAKSEVKTSIALGGLPCATFEREMVQEELRELRRDVERLENRLDSPLKSTLLSKARMKLSVAELKLKQLDDALAEAKEKEEEESGRMECGVAFVGTEVNFGDAVFRLRQETHQCVAKLVCGEVTLM